MKIRVAVTLILGAVLANGQTAANSNFDELAQRAAAALERQPEEATNLYRQAVTLRPAWAEGWFYLGASEYELKRYAEARQALTKAASLAQDNSAAWAFLGLAESALGDHALALTHILQAERLGLPDNPQFVSTVRICAATISMRSMDFTTAIEQLRPLAMGGDKSQKAIETLGAAVLTMPYLPPDVPAGKRALTNLAGEAAWALYAEHWNDAGKLFKQLGEEYPNEPGVHYLEGIYYVDRDIPAALAEFANELKITPSHALARVQIAILHLRTGEPDAALEPAREAVKLAPNNLLCHLTLGRTLLALDRIAPAIQEFETAVKMDSAYPHTHFYLGQAYQRAGREKDAQREQLEFTRLKSAGSPTAVPGPHTNIRSNTLKQR